MDSLQERQLTRQEGAHAVALAREALDTYVKRDMRAQLGRQEDVFYARIGAFVQLRSKNHGRMRGTAGSYRGNDQLLDVLVEATVHAAGVNESGSSEVTTQELTNLCLSMALVERVIVTENPLDVLEPGRHMPVVGEDGWMFPTTPLEQGWDAEETLRRAYRKAGRDETAWKDGYTTILRVRTFEEEEPRGYIREIDPETYETNKRDSPKSFTSFDG